MEELPNPTEWRALYEVAARVKEIAPWQWMSEDMVFGVQNPETEDLGFVSVMGMLGEHYAIALYRGPRALYQFWSIGNGPPADTADRILEIPQLQVSWEDRNTLSARDRATIKELGYKFRGRNAWPMFRSYRPGFFPWLLEAAEARFLTHALEQALDVVPRLQKDRSLLNSLDDVSYLVRVPEGRGEELVWQDRVVRVPPPGPVSVPMPMDLQLLEALQRRPRSQYTVEIDLFMFPGMLQDRRGDRPYVGYSLMIVEAQHGMILGHELLTVETTLEALWGQIPLHTVKLFARMGSVPAQVRVRSDLLGQLLGSLAEELGFKLRRSRRLPSLDRAKRAMLDRFV